MKCPHCLHKHSKVIQTDKKTRDDIIQRIRQCCQCGKLWITKEEILDRITSEPKKSTYISLSTHI